MNGLLFIGVDGVTYKIVDVRYKYAGKDNRRGVYVPVDQIECKVYFSRRGEVNGMTPIFNTIGIDRTREEAENRAFMKALKNKEING